jgi:protein-tyrosine phosphatase
MKTKVLFVCMGNICRSPTAEGVFRFLVERQKLGDHYEIDSAGTIAYHEGEAPDKRAQAAAKKRGYDLSHIRARAVTCQDFEKFDHILVMDEDNLQSLELKAQQCGKAEHLAKVKLLLDYSTQSQYRNVPDPYYGGSEGFELVIDLIENACEQFLQLTN